MDVTSAIEQQCCHYCQYYYWLLVTSNSLTLDPSEYHAANDDGEGDGDNNDEEWSER
jgi:hypothetical protein